MSAHGSSLCPSDGHISLSDRQCRSARLMDMRSLLLLSVLLALIRGGEGQKPTVSLRPKFPQVYAGDDVTLICNREGGSKPTTWYFNRTSLQTHKDYLMLLTAVTPDNNNGVYECDQGGTKSDPYTLIVLDLEPHAQLSPSVGGAVMTKGDGRNLVLQTDDDDLENWSCFVLRGVSTFAIGLDINKEMKRAVIFAELKEAERATFWCKKKKAALRSNAVTLKKTELMVMLVPPAVPALEGESVALRCVVWGGPELEEAIFYKNYTPISKSSPEGTYTIPKATQSDTGMYSCHATYRYSHISAKAAQKEGVSDAQELKVIGGPPAAVISGSTNSLKCSCPNCPAKCTSYHWYHTPFNDPFTREKRSENDESITVEKEGLYKCRRDCGNGFSRFSNIYTYTVTANMVPILVAALLIFLGLLIILLIALKRRRGGSAIQETKQDKDKTTAGDYEQIQLKDKAVYHTLGEGTSKDQAEGGYEPLKKTQEEGVYHTVGPVEGQSEGQGQGQGGYEALKSIKVDVYHTVGPVEGQSEGQGQGQGQGGYEALKSVKGEVYHTLSSDDSKKPAGEAEGGYEQLPQKDKDYETVTVEDNPYEEVKKQRGKENE
ncbi:uncharacterized protein LOC132116376 [Carassius carassius]|uniref:uncharacterized protein LOC132116376 n=1 Tax=Carassius carassius TaxID=217509 RepID=UPI0028687EF3|nr:uncharacterized protein LOC132116376 [Carassius carassius]